MPNIKSAKKRVLVNRTKAQRNKSRNSALAIDANAADKEQVVQIAVKKIDQAAAKNLIHKNNAARKKSALACKLNASK